MADFPSQQQRYDAPLIEYILQDLEGELQDEIECKKSLEQKDTALKISEATEFIEYYADRIDGQLDKMIDIDRKIRDLVVQNETLQTKDVEYTALVTSARYTEIAEKIASLNSIAESLDAFLVQKGRKGRPPL
jgi:glutamine synthetase type III